MFAEITDHERVDTKTIQLCRQVEETISSALACSTSPVLRDLYVAKVIPLKGAAVLGVQVFTPEEREIQGQGQNPEQAETERALEALEALERARGYFRAELAVAISRKRVPTLQFNLVATDPFAMETNRDND